MDSYSFQVWHNGALLLQSELTTRDAANAEHDTATVIKELVAHAFPHVPLEEVTFEVTLDDFFILYNDEYLLDDRVLVRAQTEAARTWVAAHLPQWLTLDRSEFRLDVRFERGFSSLVKLEGFRVYAGGQVSLRDAKEIESFEAFIRS